MGCIGDDGRDIVVYLLMLIPLEIIMTSTRVVKDGNRRKAVAIAGTLLALMSAVKVGWEVSNKAPSYFDMMGVLPTASSKEISKGYKAKAVELHPDKRQATGDDEDADEAFVELKAAYDILMDTNLRDVYSKFGLPGIEHKNDTSELMGSLGFFYVVWLAAAYLLTRRKAVGASQTWTFTGLLALGIFEYQVALTLTLTLTLSLTLALTLALALALALTLTSRLSLAASPRRPRCRRDRGGAAVPVACTPSAPG